MGYSKRALNCQKRITLSNSIHMMNMANPMAIDVESLRIKSGFSLEKDFTKLILMNP